MNNIEIIEKKGYRILRPKEGYVLYKDGEIFEGDVILGVNAAPSAYSTIEDVNYKEIEKKIEEADPLKELKEQRIELSKNNLAQYLKDNPLFSTVKYEEGRYYNVTMEKQQLLTSTLLSYQLDNIFGTESNLKWNDTKNVCESYSFEQLGRLSKEIKLYVEPLVEKQQQMEVKIRNCKTEEEVFSIKLDFEGVD